MDGVKCGDGLFDLTVLPVPAAGGVIAVPAQLRRGGVQAGEQEAEHHGVGAVTAGGRGTADQWEPVQQLGQVLGRKAGDVRDQLRGGIGIYTVEQSQPQKDGLLLLAQPVPNQLLQQVVHGLPLPRFSAVGEVTQLGRHCGGPAAGVLLQLCRPGGGENSRSNVRAKAAISPL